MTKSFRFTKFEARMVRNLTELKQLKKIITNEDNVLHFSVKLAASTDELNKLQETRQKLQHYEI